MTSENENTPTRPLGFWLRAVDRLLIQEFRTAFATEGLTRGEWRLLNLIGGDVVTPELRTRLSAQSRWGGGKLGRLIERGWVEPDHDGWTLTDSGRAAQQRLSVVVDGIREKVAATVSEQDFATTMASLEAIARGLGWDENTRLPRGGHRDGRRGEHHGGHRDEHRGGRCDGPRDRFARSDRAARRRQDAYERGFDAGFSRGRDA